MESKLDLLKQKILSQIEAIRLSQQLVQSEEASRNTALSIKVKTPNQRGVDYHMSRASVKILDEMGIKKYEVSSRAVPYFTRYNPISKAKSKIDRGNADRI